MVTRIAIIISLLTLGVNAQTIHVTDQNIFDLVPDRDAISGLAGAQRIKASFWENNEYTIPLDVADALPVTLTISSTVDDYTVTVLNSATSTPPNVVWWVVPFLNAGSYRAQATAVFTDDQFPVFDRFLTLTNVPAAPTSFFLTNEVTVGAVSVTNIFGDTIITNVITSDIIITNVTQFVTESNTVVYTSGVSSISTTGAVDGVLTFEGNAVTQTGTTFNFSYVDTDTDDGFTNIVTEGSGNVITNLVYGGRTVTQQLGTVSGGGGGGDVYLASNNVFTTTNIFDSSVGIGTNTPASLLHVSGNARVDGTIFTYGQNSIVSDANGNMRIGVNKNDTMGGNNNVVLGGNLGTTGSKRSFISGGTGNVILGGDNSLWYISSGDGSVIAGGREGANITGGSGGHFITASRRGDIDGGAYSAWIANNGFESDLNGSFILAAATGEYNDFRGTYNTILSYGNNLLQDAASSYTLTASGSSVQMVDADYSTHLSALNVYNSGQRSIITGTRITNTHSGNLIWHGYDGDTNYVTSATSNTVLFFTGGFGINTNNPQADLHVNGMVQIDSVKVYASGTNLYLTDGSSFTNLITTSPL
jgi:hypothetical protein